MHCADFALGIPTCYQGPITHANIVKRGPINAQCETEPGCWNIGCVGSPRIEACIGHVDFMLFVSISFPLVSQRELNFRWNMGLKEVLATLKLNVKLMVNEGKAETSPKSGAEKRKCTLGPPYVTFTSLYEEVSN